MKRLLCRLRLCPWVIVWASRDGEEGVAPWARFCPRCSAREKVGESGFWMKLSQKA